MSALRPFGFAVLVVLAIIAGLALLLLATGYHPGTGLRALWSGSVGTWYALTSATLVRTVPLLLTGCAVAIAFRAGVFNVGAEGQLLVGAAAGAAAALALSGWGIVAQVVALVVGALAGGLWAGIAAQLRARFGVLEVISTIMLNFVALYLVSYLVRGPLQEPTRIYPQSATLVDATQLARIPGAGRLHVGLLIAFALIIVSGWALRHTAAGFRLRAAGESPSAARSAGLVDVARVTGRAFLLSGALAGLAGAVEVLGVTYALYENISPGYGYTAIAIALLARLDPWRVPLAALLFGALQAGAGAMQRDASVPSTLVTIMEAAVILAIVGAQALGARRGPALAAPQPPGGATT